MGVPYWWIESVNEWLSACLGRLGIVSRRCGLAKRSAQNLPRNNVSLDFARPLANAANAHLSKPALEREVFGHPEAAKHLHTAVNDAPPASVATNLAMAASFLNGSPRSALAAASSVIQVACRISISLSTSIHWMACLDDSGAPNVSRCGTYSSAIAWALMATPIQPAA